MREFTLFFLLLVVTSCTQSVPTQAPAVPPAPAVTAAPALGDTKVRLADGMAMVYVPGGSFPMGTSADQAQTVLASCSLCTAGWIAAEQPQHTVHLDGFWLDRTEVTNAQYRPCVEAGLCRLPNCVTGTPTYDDPTNADHPVVCASWVDAVTYCLWAGAQLPTEAEWEYAARGPQGNIYPWGNTFEPQRLNFFQQGAYDVGQTATTPVGSYPPGASWCGALDMAGNVWEWMADFYDVNYYSLTSSDNPAGPPTGQYRVVRGGGWYNDAAWVRSAVRVGNGQNPELGDRGISFRCVERGMQGVK